MGLPWEGLPPQPGKTDWQQCFLGSHGLTSDDAQHAAIALQSLRESEGDPERFRSILGRRLFAWFLCLPPGIGLATLRASVKLGLGFRAPKSGVRSAGNGPAMRAPILGWELWNQPEKLDEFLRISTETTHADPLAVLGAGALGRTIARIRAGVTDEAIVQGWLDEGSEAVWLDAIGKAVRIRDPREFLLATGQSKGVGGFICHTVPSAVSGGFITAAVLRRPFAHPSKWEETPTARRRLSRLSAQPAGWSPPPGGFAYWTCRPDRSKGWRGSSRSTCCPSRPSSQSTFPEGLCGGFSAAKPPQAGRSGEASQAL